MRFKRLRIAVGISIIIFILFIANVILFGHTGGAKAIISNKENNQIVLLPDTPTITQTNVQANTKNSQTNTQTVSQVTSSAPAPRIIYQPIRTRAS